MTTAKPLQLDFVTVDVFTETKYEGNPLAIVKVPKSTSLTQAQKQAVAREFNFSETTFLHEREGDECEWTVDIFTTTAELPFAGHPTIGTAAYVLSEVANERRIEDGTVRARFNIKAGHVELVYDVEKRRARAAIPHDFHVHRKKMTRDELRKLQPRLVDASQRGEVELRHDFPYVSVVKGMTFLLVELENVEALALVSTSAERPSSEGLDQGWDQTFVGTYYFVRMGEGADGCQQLRTRMIVGSIEDPAAGSAASALAGYLSLLEDGRKQAFRYAITQGVEMGRRSEIGLDIVMAEENGISEVFLEGQVVRVMEGRLTL